MEKYTKNFCRNLRLKENFHNEASAEDDEDTSLLSQGPLVKNKSQFTPATGRNKTLDYYINFIKAFPKENQCNQRHFNTSKGEAQAIHQLKCDPNMVCKEADKGGALVVMDKNYYQSAMEEMVQDQSTYKKSDQGAENSTICKIKILMTKHKNEFCNEEIDYVTNFEPKTSQFYGLPKIHKSQTIIQEITKQNNECVHVPMPEDLTFRPIIAGPVCPTHRLSNFLDIILKPLVTKMPSYVRDSTHFVNGLPTSIKEGHYLVTFDVTNLYGSIPHKLGLEAIEYWLTRHPVAIDQCFSHDFILKGIKLILENNVFMFSDQYYTQTKGTAMGTKIGPTYATLVMGYLEVKLYDKIKEEKGTEIVEQFIQAWKRFLDDCFCTWDPYHGTVEYLTNILNGLHPDIKFTVNASQKQLSFLDVLVIITNGTKVSTDIYSKPTDTKNYLLYSSCHPRHVKIGVPTTLATRLKTIISDEKVLKIRYHELKQDLKKRGYPIKVIDHGIRIADAKNRECLLNPLKGTNSANQSLPVVTTYDPNGFNLFNLVKNTVDSLNSDSRLKSLLPKLTLINSKRQAPNLKRILTRAKFTKQVKPVGVKGTVTKCIDKRCGTCSVILEGSQYRLKDSGVTLTPNEDLNCSVKMVLYVIKCIGCGSDYIGSTIHLRHRVALHKSQINCKHNRTCPVSEHLDLCGRGKFKIFPFLKMKDSSERELKDEEEWYIKKYKPALNSTMFT